MQRKVHRTRYAQPSLKRLGKIPLRKQFHLSVREVARLLQQPAIQSVIPSPDANLYKKYADCNLTRTDLAKSQGISEPSLLLLIESIETDILRRALFVGILQVTVSDSSKPDGYDFEEWQNRKIID